MESGSSVQHTPGAAAIFMTIRLHAAATCQAAMYATVSSASLALADLGCRGKLIDLVDPQRLAPTHGDNPGIRQHFPVPFFFGPNPSHNLIASRFDFTPRCQAPTEHRDRRSVRSPGG